MEMIAANMHDMLQSIIIIGSVFAGWRVWSFVLQMGSLPKPGKKMVYVEDESEDVDSETNFDIREEVPDYSDEKSSLVGSSLNRVTTCRAQGLLLLESYGIFGASPGSWSNPFADIDAAFDDKAFADDIRSDVQMEDSAHSHRSADYDPGRALLEHYGVFGADPGSWSGSFAES